MSEKMIVNPLTMNPVDLVGHCVVELCQRANAVDAKPMPQIAIDCLRLDGKRLPPSLRRYLSYDYTFYSMCSGWGEFDNAVPIGSETPNEWDPVYLEDEIRRYIEDLAWKSVEELTLTQGKNEAIAGPLHYLKLSLKGSLFRLPNIGNQTHFLYVGKADQNGEYPVLAFEMKGDLTDDGQNVFWGQLNCWVKYPNFAVYLYDQIFDSDVYPDDFAAAMDEIYRNNPELSGPGGGSLSQLLGG